MDGGANFGFLGDVWSIVLLFAEVTALGKLCLVSRSMNALVWSTMKELDFGEVDWDKKPPVSSNSVLEYLQKSPNLKSLVIAYESAGPAMPVFAPKIEELEFYRYVEDEATQAAVDRPLWNVDSLTQYWCNFKFLQKLIIPYSPYATSFPTDVGVHPTVTHLELDGPQLRVGGAWPPNSDSTFLSEIFPNLTTLILELWAPAEFDCSLIPSSTLAKLISFRIWGSGHPRVTGIETLTQCSNLTDLVLDDCRPNSYEFLASLENLENLELDGTQADPRSIRSLTNLKKLRSLDVFRTPIQFDDLGHLTQLQKLFWALPQELEGHVPRGSMKALKNHTNLICLNMRSNRRDYGHYISRLTNLTLLPLGGVRMGDDGIFHLQNLTKLSQLDISSCDITNHGWGYLTRLTNLTQLNMSLNPKIDDFGLRRLRLFPYLVSVGFHGQKLVEGKGLDQLTNLVHLERLNLSSTSLKSKYFTHLTKLNLAELDVSNTPITDHVLACLDRMKCCMIISMYNCPKLSRKALLAQRYHPRVSIRWEIDFFS
jgi:hypothetical protein